MTEYEAAPPTEFDPDDPSLFVTPPLWPKVVGIISTVFAGLGLTCMGCGVVGLFVFLPMAEKQMPEPMPDPMKPDAIAYAMMGIGLAMTFVLLGAGITTISRRPIGRMLHLIWAGASVPLTIANLAYQIHQQSQIQQWVADNPGSQWAQQQNPIGAIIGMAVGVVMGLGWPVFCLIWFGLIKNKPHHMTGAHDPHDPHDPDA